MTKGNEVTTTDVNLVVSQLDPHQKQISEHEAGSIIARWEFGRVLRVHIPEGKKQLPVGVRAAVTEKYELEASEITRRMQLAEKFATQEQVVDACTRCGDSWRRIIREELVKRRDGNSRKETPWIDKQRELFTRALNEAGESDERRDEFVAMVRDELRSLGVDVVEAAA